MFCELESSLSYKARRIWDFINGFIYQRQSHDNSKKKKKTAVEIHAL